MKVKVYKLFSASITFYVTTMKIDLILMVLLKIQMLAYKYPCHCYCLIVTKTGFLQASLCRIQGLLKDITMFFHGLQIGDKY